MTRDDVIAMAREAGMALAIDDSRYGYMERFAALVAAREREACAQVCDEHAMVSTSGEGSVWSASCASAIRARGQKGGV